jgi:outer membrane protein assembly factor BamE (lipoprotein component of BamABCDE complex)
MAGSGKIEISRNEAMKHAGFITCTVLAAVLAACSPRSNTHGNLLTDGQLADIKVGQTTKAELMRLVGPPSSQGTFDAQVWYYIGRQVEQWAFFSPHVKQQKSLAVYFDQNNVVENIQIYGKDDTRKVEIVKRETPTSGRSLGFFEQMIDNMGIFRKR